MQLVLTMVLLHAEFKIDQNGNIFFIEVGARGGGDFISYDLVKLSTGYDYVERYDRSRTQRIYYTKTCLSEIFWSLFPK